MISNFYPTEKATAIDDYNEMLKIFHDFPFKKIVFNNYINYSYSPVTMGVDLKSMPEIQTDNLLRDVEPLKHECEIIPAVGRHAIQLKLPNLIDQSEHKHIFIPIMIGMILEQTLLTEENKSLFFIGINFVTPKLPGRIKFIV